MKHTLVFHIIGLSKKLQKSLGFKHQKLPLSYSQASALMVISSQKEINQKEIATKLHLEPPTVVKLIDELEKLKLVIRGTANGDRRKYQIILTAKGKEIAAKIQEKTAKLENFLRKELSSNELHKLMDHVEKISESLSKWKGGDYEIPGTKRPLAA